SCGNGCLQSIRRPVISCRTPTVATLMVHGNQACKTATRLLDKEGRVRYRANKSPKMKDQVVRDHLTQGGHYARGRSSFGARTPTRWAATQRAQRRHYHWGARAY